MGEKAPLTESRCKSQTVAIIDGHIRCCTCGELKPLDEYAPSRVREGNGRCRTCCRLTTPGGKAWRAKASPEELKLLRLRSSEYYLRNKPRLAAGVRARRLAVDYGLSVDEYEAMLAAQDGRCACCGTTNPNGHGCMSVDHSHVTGAVRGLLCGNCNRAIGLLGDTVDGVRRAVAYLERFDATVRPTLRVNLMREAQG